jgi:hypothetical protein
VESRKLRIEFSSVSGTVASTIICAPRARVSDAQTRPHRPAPAHRGRSRLVHVDSVRARATVHGQHRAVRTHVAQPHKRRANVAPIFAEARRRILQQLLQRGLILVRDEVRRTSPARARARRVKRAVTASSDMRSFKSASRVHACSHARTHARRGRCAPLQRVRREAK